MLVGVGLALGGVLIGKGVQRLLADHKDPISHRAHEMLSGARSRDELSRTMAIQVDDIAAQCRLADERFLATTMALMVDEYGASTTFDDRQKALMNAVALLEKLNAKLSPWYVRYDKLIAFVVTLVGVVSGLVTILQNAAKLIKGS